MLALPDGRLVMPDDGDSNVVPFRRAGDLDLLDEEQEPDHYEPPAETDWLRRDAAEALARGDFAAAERAAAELRRRTSVVATIPTYGPDEIFAPLPPIDWTVEGLALAPGPITGIVGRGEAGKTLALQSLELAIATGSKIWGELRAEQGPVTHVDFEQGKYLTFLRFQRLGNAMGYDLNELRERDLIRCAVYPETKVELDSRPSWERLCEGRRLVVIDSFRAACPKIDENSSEAREPLDMLSAVSEETGATIIVLLHGRKTVLGSPGGKIDEMRGSSALHDAVASGYLLQTRGENQPTVATHIKSRWGQKREPFGLQYLDVPNGSDPKWGLAVSMADLTDLQRRADERAERELLERAEQYIRRKPDCTTAMIREHLHKRHGLVLAVLEELEGGGKIHNNGTEKRAKWRGV